MKKFSILILALVALTGFNACTSDDDVVFIAQPDPEGISFLNTFSSMYILTNATAENTAERFVWNEIDVDVPTNLSYEVQGSTTADFNDFTIFGSTSTNNLAVTVKQLMDLAEEAGLDNDPNTEEPNTGTLYVRVVASAGTAGEMAHTSEVKSITVTLPESGEEEETFTNFFMVGDVTAAGWSEKNNNTPLFRDAENENLFHFTGRFAGGSGKEGFKLLEILGQWQPQWGIRDGNLTNSTILGEDPSAFPVDADGYYTFTMNIDEMTYSFEPYDASGAATYDVIGLVGAGTTVGWPNDDNPTPDILLTKSTFDPHIWNAQDVELIEGGIKFRADQAWNKDWGGGENFPSGIATSSDIIVSKAGTYDVWFNDLTGRYIFIEQSED